MFAAKSNFLVNCLRPAPLNYWAFQDLFYKKHLFNFPIPGEILMFFILPAMLFVTKEISRKTTRTVYLYALLYMYIWNVFISFPSDTFTDITWAKDLFWLLWKKWSWEIMFHVRQILFQVKGVELSCYWVCNESFEGIIIILFQQAQQKSDYTYVFESWILCIKMRSSLVGLW